MARKRDAGPPDPATAYDVAVRLLGLRSHSAADLGRKLSRRGFDGDTVAATLARLAGHGYLDDAAYARALVGRRSRSRGAAAIRAELGARGVGRDLAQLAVAELDPEAELSAAGRLLEPLLGRAEPGSLRSLLDVAGPRLLRRGFSPAIVREACRRALATGA